MPLPLKQWSGLALVASASKWAGNQARRVGHREPGQFSCQLCFFHVFFGEVAAITPIAVDQRRA